MTSFIDSGCRGEWLKFLSLLDMIIFVSTVFEDNFLHGFGLIGLPVKALIIVRDVFVNVSLRTVDKGFGFDCWFSWFNKEISELFAKLCKSLSNKFEYDSSEESIFKFLRFINDVDEDEDDEKVKSLDGVVIYFKLKLKLKKRDSGHLI